MQLLIGCRKRFGVAIAQVHDQNCNAFVEDAQSECAHKIDLTNINGSRIFTGP